MKEVCDFVRTARAPSVNLARVCRAADSILTRGICSRLS